MFDEYLNQLNKVKLLSKEEEKKLWVDFKDKGDKLARQKLIISFQPLVFKLVNQFTVLKDMKMDLIQEATVGLIDAIDSYDYHRGTPFTTYAVYFIKGRIIDFIKKGIRKEVVPLDLVNNMSILSQFKLSNLEQKVEKNLLVDRIKEEIATLPDKERHIMNEFCIRDRKADQVADEMNISLSYLYRLQKKAIKRIRGRMSRFINQWT